MFRIFAPIFLVAAILLLLPHFSTFSQYKILLVQSGSMEPSIHTGDLIIVKPFENYSPGDVITFFNSSQQKVTHRITKIQNQNHEEQFLTKGDANNSEDVGSVHKKQILGKVTIKLPYLGYLVTFSKTIPGLIILIIIPSVIIVYDELLKIRKHFLKK